MEEERRCSPGLDPENMRQIPEGAVPFERICAGCRLLLCSLQESRYFTSPGLYSTPEAQRGNQLRQSRRSNSRQAGGSDSREARS